MRKTAILTAGLLLGAGLVAGCGSSGDNTGASGGSGYCDSLKAAAASIRSFTATDATPDLAKFDDFIAKAHTIAEKAPSSIKDDWTVLLGAVDDLTKALDEAGIKMSDLASLIATGQMPAGVDASKLTALTPKLQALSGAGITKAGDAIRKQAKDDCKIDLSKSS